MNEPKETPTILNIADHLSSSVEELTNHVSALTVKLDPLLKQDVSSKQTEHLENPKTVPLSSALRDKLVNVVGEVRANVERLQALRKRIDL